MGSLLTTANRHPLTLKSPVKLPLLIVGQARPELHDFVRVGVQTVGAALDVADRGPAKLADTTPVPVFRGPANACPVAPHQRRIETIYINTEVIALARQDGNDRAGLDLPASELAALVGLTEKVAVFV